MHTQNAAMVLPPREGFAPGGTGAIGLLLERLAGAMPGWHNTVIGMEPSGFGHVDYRQAKLSWLPAQQWRRYAGGVLAEMRRLKPAIIEVHNRPDVALFLAQRLPSTPVCLVLNNDPQGMRAARTPAERTALFATLALVANSTDWLRRRLLEGVSQGSAVVFPNCLDLRTVPSSPSERDKVILFAGRVVADKGVDAFVEAAGIALPRLPGWRAEIIGGDRFRADSPETDFTRALRPRAAAAGVAMLGYRPHDQVLAAMSRAAVVVVPSRWPEPFGLTALEALAAGATLLCSQTGGLPEVCGDAAVPVSAEDPSGMAEAMVRVGSDASLRANYEAAGRARAALFDVSIAGATLSALRADVLSTWPRRTSRPI